MDKIYAKKYKILIVDDSEINRSILKNILENEYEIYEAECGEKAIEFLQQQSFEFSLMLLDIIMPGISGFDVLDYMNKYGIIEDIPVMMISSECTSEYIKKAYDRGAVDFIGRPFEVSLVKRRVKNTIALYAKQKRLIDFVADQIYEKEKNNYLMIMILSHIVEFRNGESRTHVVHINMITELLLRELVKTCPEYRNISLSDIRLISTASSLHDIGKIAIPDEILNKPGRFTPEEFNIMKKHSEFGASMIENLTDYQSEPLLKTSYEICRWHHERYDGKGYPDGLVGDDIPISAQVVSIADVYDALTSKRCYKEAYSHEKAMEMICGGECGTFNPVLIECLKSLSEKLKRSLKSGTSSHQYRREASTLASEIMNNKDLSSSGLMIQHISIEKSRAEFLEKKLSSISFTFYSNPPVLSLSKEAARLMKLNHIIHDPHGNAMVKSIHDKTTDKLLMELCNSTADNPEVTVDGTILLGTEEKECTFHCKSIWLTSEEPVYLGVTGIIILK